MHSSGQYKRFWRGYQNLEVKVKVKGQNGVVFSLLLYIWSCLNRKSIFLFCFGQIYTVELAWIHPEGCPLNQNMACSSCDCHDSCKVAAWFLSRNVSRWQHTFRRLENWHDTQQSNLCILGQDSSAAVVGAYLCEVAQREEFCTLCTSVGSTGTMVLCTWSHKLRSLATSTHQRHEDPSTSNQRSVQEKLGVP